MFFDDEKMNTKFKKSRLPKKVLQQQKLILKNLASQKFWEDISTKKNNWQKKSFKKKIINEEK